MNAPQGDLTILREYSCGCIIYRDQKGQEWPEDGVFCALPGYSMPYGYGHRERLVRGTETQEGLFS